jgi:hypothetical protein
MVHTVIDNMTVWQYRSDVMPERVLYKTDNLPGVSPFKQFPHAGSELGERIHSRDGGINLRCASGVQLDLEQATGGIKWLQIKTGAFVIY